MKGRSVITEDELDARFGTRALLESGGDYALKVVVLEGDRIGDVTLDDDEVSSRFAKVSKTSAPSSSWATCTRPGISASAIA